MSLAATIHIAEFGLRLQSIHREKLPERAGISGSNCSPRRACRPRGRVSGARRTADLTGAQVRRPETDFGRVSSWRKDSGRRDGRPLAAFPRDGHPLLQHTSTRSAQTGEDEGMGTCLKEIGRGLPYIMAICVASSNLNGSCIQTCSRGEPSATPV